MNILITGINGYLGARMSELLLKEPDVRVFGTYLSGGGGSGESESSNQFLLDITQEEKVIQVCEAVKPDVVIHTAAIAHGESSLSPDFIRQVNVNGTENVLSGARKHNARFVYISTVAALVPDSDYGASKLDGEKKVQESFLESLIVRPSVIIGHSPNNDPDIMFNNIVNGVLKGESVVVDSEWKFQPSWIDHVCEVVNLWIKKVYTDSGPIYPIIPIVKSRYEIAEDILGRFNKHATAVKNPRYKEDEIIGKESLTRNNLPVYGYEQVIDNITSELKKKLV